MDFQTPLPVCQYMTSLIPNGMKYVLEPTPGEGNLVKVLRESSYQVDTAIDFFNHDFKIYYDAILMNPPFSPMKLGYEILFKCMNLSDIIIAIMPWLTIINSQKRTQSIIEFGLQSITHLPRKIFKGARVQTCILQMSRGFSGSTIWRAYNG